MSNMVETRIAADSVGAALVLAFKAQGHEVEQTTWGSFRIPLCKDASRLDAYGASLPLEVCKVYPRQSGLEPRGSVTIHVGRFTRTPWRRTGKTFPQATIDEAARRAWTIFERTQEAEQRRTTDEALTETMLAKINTLPEYVRSTPGVTYIPSPRGVLVQFTTTDETLLAALAAFVRGRVVL